MKSKKKRKTKRSGKKGIYVLPNLITSASLFAGFYAMIAGIQGRFEMAATAILIACVLDALDGRIARLTHSTSHFGSEYDSLSDLVAFGVAPGILAFQWAMEPFGRLGWLACFLYVICGALRLARFNAQKNTQKSSHFSGLPIPGAAGAFASFVLFTESLGFTGDAQGATAIVFIYLLSFLMVSTIPYPSFKELDLRRRKPFHVLVAIILVLIVIAYKPKIMLFLVLGAYIVAGPVMGWARNRDQQPHEGVLPSEKLAAEKEHEHP